MSDNHEATALIVVSWPALFKYAERRTRRHVQHASQRILSENHELVGLAGEWEFARQFGIPMDLTPRPTGDEGVDFTTPLGTVDVKTRRHPEYLLHEVGKPAADILVLAHYRDGTPGATLVGWMWTTEVVKFPTRRMVEDGPVNYTVPRVRLKSIFELLWLLHQAAEARVNSVR